MPPGQLARGFTVSSGIPVPSAKPVDDDNGLGIGENKAVRG
jgi:hypothetical protein